MLPWILPSDSMSLPCRAATTWSCTDGISRWLTTTGTEISSGQWISAPNGSCHPRPDLSTMHLSRPCRAGAPCGIRSWVRIPPGTPVPRLGELHQRLWLVGRTSVTRRVCVQQPDWAGCTWLSTGSQLSNRREHAVDRRRPSSTKKGGHARAQRLVRLPLCLLLPGMLLGPGTPSSKHSAVSDAVVVLTHSYCDHTATCNT
jgi:hypothetical protein